MVLLTITPAAKAAVEIYRNLNPLEQDFDEEDLEQRCEVGSSIEHQRLVDISRYLTRNLQSSSNTARDYRLDALLKGASVYQAPQPPKPEPTSEYKALMQRLRQQEEQKQYERMINPPAPAETFNQRFPSAGASFGSGINIGHNAPDEVDELTYADVNRQMVLIINVLISIICTSVAVWMAARRWSVPQRLGLSFSSSTVVAVAEVVIYMGYIRRIQDAKTTERKKAEKKEIVDTWIIDGKSTSHQATLNDTTRFRKGKHR